MTNNEELKERFPFAEVKNGLHNLKITLVWCAEQN